MLPFNNSQFTDRVIHSVISTTPAQTVQNKCKTFLLTLTIYGADNPAACYATKSSIDKPNHTALGM